MCKNQHIIELSADPFDLDIDVSIRPAPEGELLDRSFSRYAVAKKYADDLAKQHGWVLIDRLGCDPVVAGFT